MGWGNTQRVLVIKLELAKWPGWVRCKLWNRKLSKSPSETNGVGGMGGIIT